MGSTMLRADDLGYSFELLDAYREAGGNAIDNSAVYGPGIAEALKAYYEARGEDALVRLDKGNHHSASGDEGRRVTRQDLDHDVRLNLRGQGVSYSDFYLLHRDDERVPAAEVVQWLHEQKELGRVRAFGVSNWKTHRITEANDAARERGLQPLSISSSNLALAKPNEAMWWEAHSVDAAEREWYAQTRFPLFSWSAGGGGFFARVKSPDIDRVYQNAGNVARRERVERLASDLGHTPSQIALAWTLCQPANVWALVGPRTVEQVQEATAACDIVLDSKQIAWLESG